MMNRFQLGRDAQTADNGDKASNGLGGSFRAFPGTSSGYGSQAGLASGFTADPLELANASAEIRARQAALSAGPVAQRSTTAESRTLARAQSRQGQSLNTSSDHEANVSALRNQIKQELAQLRGDLTSSIQANAPRKLDGELSALRSELAQIRNMVARHDGTEQQDQWKRLSRSMDSFSAHQPAGKTDIAILRDELAEMRALVATSAREDSLRQLSSTYADLSQRIDRNTAAAQDGQSREALARLIAQADATQAAVESLPSTRHLSNVEARIDGLVSSLEKLMGNRSEMDSNMLSVLEARLNQMTDSMARLDANSHTMPDEQAIALQRLEQRIANLADQLQPNDADANAPTLAALDAMSERLDALSLRQPVESHQIDLLAHRLDDMSSRLDGIADASSQSDALETILGQIGALQGKLDDASPRNMLPTLEHRLDSINSGLDRMATRPIEPDFSTIEAQMQRMAAQIDGLAPQDYSQDISSLEASVRAMHDKLDTIPEPTGFDESTGNRLERQIAELAAQLEHSAAPQPADPKHLAQLESQISNISQLLSETNQHAHAVSEAMGPAGSFAGNTIGSNEEAIAARFDALEAQLSNQQVSLLEAARSAAHEVAAQQPTDNQNNELLLKLAEDLDRLHVTAAESSDGTRQTFDAVHTTLERIVERLEQIEVAGGTAAAAPVAMANAQPDMAHREMAPRETAPREMAMAGDENALLRAFDEATPPPMPQAAPFEPYDDLPNVSAPGLESELPQSADTPLEPGQLPQFNALDANTAPLPAGGGNDGMDFIAAARRAARAAADEAAPKTSAPSVLAGDAPVEKASRFKRTGKAKATKAKKPKDDTSGESKLRRPIILASAAVLLALGTMKLAPIVSDMLSGDPEVASVAIEPSAAMQDVADAAETAQTDEIVMAAEDAPTRVIPLQAQPAAQTATEAATDTSTETAAKIEQPEVPSTAPIVAPEVSDDVGNAALREAASAGNPAAMFEVALRYTEGRVVDKDSQLALQWYQQAAEKGLAPAQFRLANFLEKGMGTEQDYDAAVMWYERAVEAGNARAMHNLAVLHTEEVAGGQKVEEATRLFRDAAELGVRDSQFNLGIMYGRGLGVELDLVESYKWFALAARAGDTEAAEKRDQVANAMLPEDLDKARIAAQAWTAKPLIESANTVNIPAEWSADTPGATADVSNTSPETTGGIVVESGNVGRDVQNALLALGYGIGAADGVIGPKTASAIRDFEGRMGMPETGRPSAALLQAMLAVKAGL